ncbi:putative methionyl-tRNA formyltransferase [Rhizoctonia solani 123E]|uniref:methionyl-tRNA formyltransferase n=1 Tax=Rhizoctonia solani 123E TaxID=1423351 RepID=A0A074S2V7_9AGAM|nr:putative methionyl-tRNA formyltransferase [Rhizoctonia solani 123E]
MFYSLDEIPSRVQSLTNYVKQKVSHVLDLLVVATTPDQWVGRRRQTLSVAPLKQLAESIQIPVVHIPEDKDEFSRWIPPAPFSESARNNVLVTASFGRRVPSSCLDLFHRGRKLNVHPSLLPKYRGAAPIQHALLDGIDTTGVSVIEMENGKGFDFGDIWAQQAMNVPRGSTYVALEPQLAKLGGQLLIDVLRKAKIDTSFAARPQDHSQATKARLIKAEQSEINWATWSAEYIERTHRAIGHQVYRHTSRLQIMEMRPAAEQEKRSELNIPGEMLFEPSDNTLRICCAEGTQLVVSRLKTENKNSAKAKEWWNGIPPIWLKNGLLRLGLPHNARNSNV